MDSTTNHGGLLFNKREILLIQPKYITINIIKIEKKKEKKRKKSEVRCDG